MQALMMNDQLTIAGALDHAAEQHGEREIVCHAGETPYRYNYAALRERVRKLVNVLRDLGIKEGDRVATLAWNSHRHLELYYAVPAMGAVIHTINVRLPSSQVAFMLDHAEDVILFHDASTTALAKESIELCKVKNLRRVLMGDAGQAEEAGALSYDTLLDKASAQADWSVDDEKSAAMLCYTSGTTGDPKGVLFSHRSTILHAYAGCMPDAFAICAADVLMPLVPMFHANCWGLPYIAALAGSKQVMTGSDLAPARMVRLANEEGVTFSAGVPTIWLGVRDELEKQGLSIPTLSRIIVAGSAMAPSLMRDLDSRGITPIQAFGMTEVSPLSAIARIKPSVAKESEEAILSARLSQGRIVPGIRWRIVDDAGEVIAHDGATPGELQYRGPTVAAGYYRNEKSSKSIITDDGWLRSGDICTIDQNGYVRVVDRDKDLVKSGGEWISSIELENTLMGHPSISEAVVIAAPHPKWIERPLGVVVLKQGCELDVTAVQDWLKSRVAKWWVPDQIVAVPSIPRTGTGKYSKRELRVKFNDVYATE